MRGQRLLVAMITCQSRKRYKELMNESPSSHRTVQEHAHQLELTLLIMWYDCMDINDNVIHDDMQVPSYVGGKPRVLLKSFP
jgi:hypothetical protein